MYSATGRHLGMLRISGQLLQEHLFSGSPPGEFYRVSNGIPPDAKFIRMGVEWNAGQQVPRL